MKIMFLCAQDHAGASYNFCSAINKYTNHEAENIITNPGRYKYPYFYKFSNRLRKLVSSSANAEELRQKIYASDVIIFVEYLGIDKVMGLDRNKLKDKQIAITYGGGGFRLVGPKQRGRAWYKKINGRLTLIATSADFLATEKLPWVPRCVRTEELREKYDYSKRDPPVIAVSPSKSSDNVNPRVGLISRNFSKIINTLKSKGYKVHGMGISSHKKVVHNDTCLKLKAPASIFFDRLYPIYGINSLEAGAFESAVVTGTSAYALKVIQNFTGLKCPYIIVDSWARTQKVFENLLNAPDYTRKRGLACYDYSKKIEIYAAKRFIEILGG